MMNRLKSNTMRKGFSLVELAIVLVIIGILVGSVTGGARLVENSKLQKVIIEMKQYQTAAMTFKLSYDKLPGDYSKASDFWGADCNDNSSFSTCSCDGNGNGIIGETGTPTTSCEALRSLYHLKRAELIVADFLVEDADSSDFKDSTTPDSSWETAQYSMWGTKNIVAATTEKNAVLWIGEVNSSTWNSTATFTPNQARIIDKKIDDSVPDQGKFVGLPNTVYGAGFSVTAADCATGTPLNYNTSGANANNKNCGGTFVIE